MIKIFWKQVKLTRKQLSNQKNQGDTISQRKIQYKTQLETITTVISSFSHDNTATPPTRNTKAT